MTVQNLCPELEADERVKEPSLIIATVLVQFLRSELAPRLVLVPPPGGTFPRSDPSPLRRGVARRTHVASPRGALHLELAQGFQNRQ